MTRKILHIAVSFLLLAATSGITITRHYCGENLISVVFGQQADSCCDGPCQHCHNETVHYQVEDNFTLNQVQFNPDDIASFDLMYVPVLTFLDGFTDEVSNPGFIQFIDKYPPPKLASSLPALQTFRL